MERFGFLHISEILDIISLIHLAHKFGTDSNSFTLLNRELILKILTYFIHETHILYESRSIFTITESNFYMDNVIKYWPDLTRYLERSYSQHQKMIGKKQDYIFKILKSNNSEMIERFFGNKPRLIKTWFPDIKYDIAFRVYLLKNGTNFKFERRIFPRLELNKEVDMVHFTLSTPKKDYMINWDRTKEEITRSDATEGIILCLNENEITENPLTQVPNISPDLYSTNFGSKSTVPIKASWVQELIAIFKDSDPEVPIFKQDLGENCANCRFTPISNSQIPYHRKWDAEFDYKKYCAVCCEYKADPDILFEKVLKFFHEEISNKKIIF